MASRQSRHARNVPTGLIALDHDIEFTIRRMIASHRTNISAHPVYFQSAWNTQSESAFNSAARPKVSQPRMKALPPIGATAPIQRGPPKASA